MGTAEDIPISTGEHIAREMQDLELALLHEGVDQRTAGAARCSCCGRTPLIGERVYRYQHDAVVCELCRSVELGPPLAAELVHGPAYGHTIRIVDQRAA